MSKDKARGQPRKSCISTAWLYALKWIACITMLLDHIALFFQEQCHISAENYVALRYIGRIAFPLFAYCMIESFHYTKNRGKHLLKIGILALVSELPYDIINLTERGIIDWTHQNVCVSLFLSFLLLMITDKCTNNIRKLYHNSKFGIVVEDSAKIILVGAFLLAGQLLHVDFGFGGILFAALLQFARGRKHKTVFRVFAFIAFGLTQAHIAYLLTAIPFVLICLAEHGSMLHEKTEAGRLLCSKPSRKLTGIFYPLHMAVLIIVRFIMSV